MRFTWYEIRAAVDTGEETQSFLGATSDVYGDGGEYFTAEGAWADALAYQAENGGKAFWTLYGRDFTLEGDFRLVAIGDFSSFEAAYEVLCAILAPMRKAADMIANDDGHSADDAASLLEDICNQSSTEERL